MANVMSSIETKKQDLMTARKDGAYREAFQLVVAGERAGPPEHAHAHNIVKMELNQFQPKK